MTDIRPMTYVDANERFVRVTKLLRELETEHTKAIQDAADAEALYRKSLGQALDKHRADGLSVEHSVAKARADCYVLSRDRDVAAGAVRTVLEKLDNRRGERDALDRLVAWSHSIDIRDGGHAQ